MFNNILRLAITLKYLADSHHNSTILNVNFTDDTKRMIFQWLSLNIYNIRFVKVSTVHIRESCSQWPAFFWNVLTSLTMNISVVACQLEECRLDGSTFFLDMITWELSCWGFAKILGLNVAWLVAVIDRWSWLLVVNEWNAAWTVEPSSFCVSVSHYKISCHPIILIWQSVLVWFICVFFCTGCSFIFMRGVFWPPGKLR